MGEVADDKVCQLVRGLCESYPDVKEVRKEEEFELPELDLTIYYDQILATLVEMGYDIDIASKSIRDCGSTDLGTVVDYINTGPPNLTDSVFINTTKASKVDTRSPSLDIVVKIEKEDETKSEKRQPQMSNGEASTSCIEASTECGPSNGGMSEDEIPRHSKRSVGLFEPRGTPSKGKAPMTPPVEDFENDVDMDQWDQEDAEDEADLGGRWAKDGKTKEETLIRAGFSDKNVSDAIEACGKDSSVDDLANYILSNLGLDSNDDSWDDEDMLSDEEIPVRYDSKGGKKWGKEFDGGSSSDWSSEESMDDGNPIRANLRTMGFPSSEVSAAIEALGKDASEDALVDYLLSKDRHVSGGGKISDDEGDMQNLSKVQQLKKLTNHQYSTAACARAIDNNAKADIVELLDYLEAEKLSNKFTEEDNARRRLEDEEVESFASGKRKTAKRQKTMSSKYLSKKKDKMVEEQDLLQHVHRNTKGFGVPGSRVILRELSEDVRGPPYFYFENVALTPKDEWDNIKRHLYNIAPEFVDSLNFSPCRRPRGYVHNLPVVGRQDLLPKPPMSVQELLPGAELSWPRWDPRTKLNTINTRIATDFVNRKISQNMANIARAEELNLPIQERDTKEILMWARKWNLVWISPGVLAPLNAEEIETCLGFDVNHTRVIYSQVDRAKLLGNSFQINTVAYHLSVLKPLFPSGMRVLSLFSGIGGAEVALHKLGIRLTLVVSVEIDPHARKVVKQWWKVSRQTGTLIHSYQDVKHLDNCEVQKLCDRYGGFDLVIGGSPCNNLSGNNRCSRTGLAGPASIAFFEFPRILEKVRECMRMRR